MNAVFVWLRGASRAEQLDDDELDAIDAPAAA